MGKLAKRHKPPSLSTTSFALSRNSFRWHYTFFFNFISFCCSSAVFHSWCMSMMVWWCALCNAISFRFVSFQAFIYFFSSRRKINKIFEQIVSFGRFLLPCHSTHTYTHTSLATFIRIQIECAHLLVRGLWMMGMCELESLVWFAFRNRATQISCTSYAGLRKAKKEPKPKNCRKKEAARIPFGDCEMPFEYIWLHTIWWLLMDKTEWIAIAKCWLAHYISNFRWLFVDTSTCGRLPGLAGHSTRVGCNSHFSQSQILLHLYVVPNNIINEC